MPTDSLIDEDIYETSLMPSAKRSVRYLLTEQISRAEGVGAAMDLGPHGGKLLVVTLGIDRVVEHGGLLVSIWGSADGRNWGTKPVVSFPQKYYCGLYSALLNLAKSPEICYLRPQWNMKAWDKIGTQPMFSFNLFLEESGARLSTAVA